MALHSSMRERDRITESMAALKTARDQLDRVIELSPHADSENCPAFRVETAPRPA